MRPSTMLDRLSTRSLGLVGLIALMALSFGAAGYAMTASFSVADAARHDVWRSGAWGYLLLTIVSAMIALAATSLLAWRQVAPRRARDAAGAGS